MNILINATSPPHGGMNSAPEFARYKPGKPTECAHCGSAIAQTHKTSPRRFCSKKCCSDFHNRQKRLRLGYVRPAASDCAHCGTTFANRFRGGRKQLYCSQGCNAKAWR